jgi:diaminopimelate epimerase
MNGAGNAILVMDLRGGSRKLTADQVRAIGRQPGLRFDQLMAMHDPETSGTETYVRIYNIDGSESGACGNGARCVAHVLAEESGARELAIETRAGLLATERRGPAAYAVDMGKPGLAWESVPLSRAVPNTAYVPIDASDLDARLPETFAAASMGNPHAVFFVDDVNGHDIERVGPLLEQHALFPERANISFAAIEAPDVIRLRVWERGAGLTLACGSGACAVAVSANRRGLATRHATVKLPGGDLDILWRDDDHVIMTGPVEDELTAALPASIFGNGP